MYEWTLYFLFKKKIAQKIQEPKTNKKPKTCKNRHPKKKKKKRKKREKKKWDTKSQIALKKTQKGEKRRRETTNTRRQKTKNERKNKTKNWDNIECGYGYGVVLGVVLSET